MLSLVVLLICALGAHSQHISFVKYPSYLDIDSKTNHVFLNNEMLSVLHGLAAMPSYGVVSCFNA